MTKYVIKRILYMFLTMFVITVMCFVLIKLLPLPAVREMGRDINLVLAKREKMGYNKPIMVQFFLYLKSIFTEWDWGVGEQMYEGLGIWDVMMQKLPYTIVVNLYSILISIPLGLGLGIYAALKKNKWQDAVISTLVMVFISVPSYVYAFLVQYIFCFQLGWFPLQLASLSQAGSIFSGKMFVSMVPAIMSLMSMWCVRLTLAAWMARDYGLRGVWMAMAIELTFRGLLFLTRLASGRWLKEKVTKQ